MREVGLNMAIDENSEKGVLRLAECNLIHRMLMKKFSLNTTIKYILDTFITQNSSASRGKHLPPNMLILNRHSNFDKGVSKVLKTTTLTLVEMLPADSEQIVSFLIDHFAIGSLTCQNLLSFLGFLEKVSLAYAHVNIQILCIFRMLANQGFFRAHLASFTDA